MSTQRTRLINPRLGTYFGIFASAFVALFLVLLILEQLQVTDREMRFVVFAIPVVLYGAIAVAAYTGMASEFFAAGRRVPAVYNGLVLAITAVGGTGIVAYTGLFFLNGYDAWSLSMGILAGFVVMGIAVAPYQRKYGAYTVPTYLARRFESRVLRLLAAAIFLVPLLLILAAEVRTGVYLAMLLTGQDEQVLSLCLAISVCAMVIFGGMRSLGWVSTAQAIAAMIAVIVPAAIIGVLQTNLPIVQLSAGPTVRKLVQFEEARQIATPVLGALDFNLAGPSLEPLERRLTAPFTSMGWLSFLFTVIVFAMGIAAAPWLLPRCTTTLGVYEVRKSLGWAIFFVGILLLTLASFAIFIRFSVMTELVGRSPDLLPDWFAQLSQRGAVAIESNVNALPMASFLFKRDAVLYAVPYVFGFPLVVKYLIIAGALAAAFAAASATTFAIATNLAEDVFLGLRWQPPADFARLNTTRVMIVLVLLLALVFLSMIKADPLRLTIWAVILSAATSFPIIILSIWWKRLNAFGAMAGLITGFLAALLVLLWIESGAIELPTPIAGVIAAPLAAIVAAVASLLSPLPQRAALDVIRDMRVPGGETVYDREMHLLRFSQRNRI